MIKIPYFFAVESGLLDLVDSANSKYKVKDNSHKIWEYMGEFYTYSYTKTSLGIIKLNNDNMETAWCFNKNYDKNMGALSLIFNYYEVNDYAKLIINNVKLYDEGLLNSYKASEYNDTIEKALVDFINHYRLSDKANKNDPIVFIFGALLITALDETQNSKLPVICEISKLLNFSDEEIHDIAVFVAIMLDEEDEIEEDELEIKSDKISNWIEFLEKNMDD